MTTVANTRQGQVEGVREGDLHVFKGVPYAAPPVGALRWLPPQPAESWSGVRSAREFGSAAHQNPIPLDILPAFSIGESMQEDCLYLNVWTPGTDGERRPVMVWIHGGAFVIGAGSQSIYDGSVLAQRGDVVVVTVNYRLGPLGFLNLREVTGGAIPASGNEGLLDQTASLAWVRDNIAAFGGDPDNVTIFGESAGGMSVGAQLALPDARGLFHKAIPQSGACSTANTPERTLRVAERVLGTLGLSGKDADALRAVTPQKLLEVQAALATPGQADEDIGGMPFQPCLDGEVLSQLPLTSVRSGSASNVPVLVGTTLEEWKLFGAADPAIFTLEEAGLLERAAAYAGDRAKPLVDAYRSSREARGAAASPTEIALALETDRVFRMPALLLAEAQRSVGANAFNYLFTWPSPSMGGMLGACHALELGFVFGTIDSSGSRDFSGSGPAADALELALQDSWLAFARTGDPSNERVGSWPAYGDARETMLLGEQVGLENAPYEAERAALDGLEDASAL